MLNQKVRKLEDSVLESAEEMLEIVNEQDEIVGLDTRKNVHKLGLLHREIHILFFTPNGEIIFQHRAKDKDTWPDMYDATVGGHVDEGMTYEETAVKECLEEVGQNVKEEDLILIKKIRSNLEDESTRKINNVFRVCYAYLFTGILKDLQIEEGKSQGFVKFKVSELEDLPENIYIKLMHVSTEYLEIYKTAIEKLKINH